MQTINIHSIITFNIIELATRSARMPEIEFGSDFNEKDAFIDLDHYRRLVHTYVDMVSSKYSLFPIVIFILFENLILLFSVDTKLHCTGQKKCPL